VLLAATLLAQLADPQVEVEWQAPEQCPDQAWFTARIERFLDRPINEAVVEPVSAKASVTEDAGRFRASLTLRSGEREQIRELEDHSCDVLAAATAFIVAVTIDPDVVFVAQDPTAEQDAEPEPVPEPDPATPEPEPEPALPDPDARRFPLRGAVRVHGNGAVGLLPGFSPGLGAAAALLVGRARVEVSGAWHFERQLDLGQSRSAEFRLWALGARGCWAPGVSKFEFPLCAGVHAGSMRGRSEGIAETATQSSPWLAARVGPGFVYLPSRYAGLYLGGEALFPLIRPQFSIENVGEVYTPPAVAGLFQFGLEVRFP
jgi:hypothetical protein